MKKPAILCVDDETVVLSSLMDQLSYHLGEEYYIETAEDGEDALALFHDLLKDEYDIPLVITDHLMPGIKGDELLIKLHGIAPKTLKILLTGQANAAAVGNVVNRANLYRYIAKPWEETDLVLTVKEAVRSYYQDKKLDEQHLELQHTYTLLDEYAHTLEQKVAERTAELEAANRELERLATMDGLTHIANRRRFDEYLAQEWRRLDRAQAPLSMILGDIDHFKRFNDTYGHLAGDTCLKSVAQLIYTTVKRPTDLVARYGGEEFAVILPHTDIKGATHLAQAIWEAIQRLEIDVENDDGDSMSVSVTLSLGVAWIVPNYLYPSTVLINAADNALYEAKENGRNCIVVKEIPPSLPDMKAI